MSIATVPSDTTQDVGDSVDSTLGPRHVRRRFVSFFVGDTVGGFFAPAVSTSATLQPEQDAVVEVDGHVFFLATKRAIDIVLSLAALIVLLPVFLASAIAVKLYDRGPVFFGQERVGKDGQTFLCFKFRSMVVDAERLQKELRDRNEHEDPRTFKMANDPRITPVGRFLRRFSIDELPQIVNVLFGQMSIVGPRPPLPQEVEMYSKSDMQRLSVKPGLTCIWQISGRSRLPFPEQVKLDIEYIRTQSIAKDMAIIVKTVPAVFSGDGAS